MRAAPRYEIRKNDKFGRYLVAARDLRSGETVLSDNAFVLGPHGDSSLVCFNCFLPLISKFVCCKACGVTPVCPGDGCPPELIKWHDEEECSLFLKYKEKGLSAMKMVQNVNGLGVLRAVLKKQRDPRGWRDFMELESHLDQRRNTNVWDCNENTVKGVELSLEKQGQKLLLHVCIACESGIPLFELANFRAPAKLTRARLCSS
ncbi:hypothetical protein EVAR_53965_1 [Eumeta japonica]|uniref:SET domain-containing protein n=1 Tax=Eumeta variegata TaxID=151549 RepID=A0A4C1Y1W4_EUMVA|nr:hypothetical protein EVAR_53965_1 [Eumeta japonica]